MFNILFWKDKKEHQYAEYPCNVYLNNALRSILEQKKKNMFAAREIKYAIEKAGGKLDDDIQKKFDQIKAMKELNGFNYYEEK